MRVLYDYHTRSRNSSICQRSSYPYWGYGTGTTSYTRTRYFCEFCTQYPYPTRYLWECCKKFIHVPDTSGSSVRSSYPTRNFWELCSPVEPYLGYGYKPILCIQWWSTCRVRPRETIFRPNFSHERICSRWGPPLSALFARRAWPWSPLPTHLPTLSGAASAVLAPSPGKACCFRFFFQNNCSDLKCLFVLIDAYHSESKF